MLNLLNTTAPTWDDPIEMLYACHDKVKKFCNQLEQLPKYLTEYGCNDMVRQAIAQIMHYFNTAAPLHHADEELDLFPELLKCYPVSETIINELIEQHTKLHQNWDILNHQLQEILDGYRDVIDSNIIQLFTQNYDHHILQEEQLFEWSQRYISEAILHQLGRNMAKRRQTQENYT